MKNLIIITFTLCYFCGVAQQQYGYYIGDKYVSLRTDTRSMVVESYTLKDTSQIAQLLGTHCHITHSGTGDNTSTFDLSINNSMCKLIWASVSLDDSMSESQYYAYIEKLKQDPRIDYVSPGLATATGHSYMSDILYVQLKDTQDVTLLKHQASALRVSILSQNKYMPLWFTLSADKHSTGNAMQVSKHLYETGLFASVEPEFLAYLRPLSNCPSDPLFQKQWYLHNTGQITDGIYAADLDIRACEAWDITKGSSTITIGMIDNGISSTHPDLNYNNIKMVDGQSSTYPATTSVYNHHNTKRDLNKEHGTQVAGIMVAQHNSIGIAGIAPDCKLISVAVDFAGNNPAQKISDAILHLAIDEQVDVINNSWGLDLCNSTQFGYASSNSNFTYASFATALQSGRHGLGTTIVFASGDTNLDDFRNSVAGGMSVAPYNLTQHIIVAGAASQCWYRKSFESSLFHSNESCDDDDDNFGSMFGRSVHLVAPAVYMTTLDNPTGYKDWNHTDPAEGGTSFAAAQVSAVVALLLSVYPCLTQHNIEDIIDKYVTKFPPTSNYATVIDPDHIHGYWNAEIGYGLLNAYAPLLFMRKRIYLQNDNNIDFQKMYSTHFVIGGREVDPLLTKPDDKGPYTIKSNGHIEAKAPEYILFEPGFEVKLGGVLDAHIAPYGGDCTGWIENLFDNKRNIDELYDGSRDDKLSTPTNPITISPNPFKKSFGVVVHLTHDEPVSIMVTDVMGQTIYSYMADETIGAHSYAIPINVSEGMYIAKVCAGENCKTVKLIKNDKE